MPEPSSSIFLSYASEDAEAALRICNSLRAAGLEVWFDQSELRGGDTWDAAIRKQIKLCALFMPVISRNTHAREEGYFRLEWKLAVDRSHLMTSSKAFLLPVVVDETRDDDEHVPDKFREVQWSRLPGGNTPPAFVERVSRLLSARSYDSAAQSSVIARPPATGVAKRAAATFRRSKITPLAIAAVLTATAMTVWFYSSSRREPRAASSAQAPAPLATTPTAVPAAAFAPPAHSLAILPFANLSGDAQQEYFSDGLTEELINVISHIRELEVSARTSSFSFKRTNADVGTIARRLNVAAILEGSVRRFDNRVRITVQLINARNGFHMWSQTYDRNLTDILALQTEIAAAVAQQLQVTLFGGEVAGLIVGGTHNPQAYDAYLRGMQLLIPGSDETAFRGAQAAFDDAIALDPGYAAAYRGRASALLNLVLQTSDASSWAGLRAQARKSAARALAIAPDFALAHATLASAYIGEADFAKAAPEIERALALAPGDAKIQAGFASFASLLGHHDVAVTAARRAVRLDPENYGVRFALLQRLYSARRFPEALVVAQEVRALNGADYDTEMLAAFSHVALGQLPQALQICESAATSLPAGAREYCLAVVYHALGRVTEAEDALEKLKAGQGDSAALGIAQVYAQWGNTPAALKWLATAEHLRDPALQILRTEWLLDPIRDEPQFKAVERRLNFPP